MASPGWSFSWCLLFLARSYLFSLRSGLLALQERLLAAHVSRPSLRKPPVSATAGLWIGRPRRPCLRPYRHRALEWSPSRTSQQGTGNSSLEPSALASPRHPWAWRWGGSTLRPSGPDPQTAVDFESAKLSTALGCHVPTKGDQGRSGWGSVLCERVYSKWGTALARSGVVMASASIYQINSGCQLPQS